MEREGRSPLRQLPDTADEGDGDPGRRRADPAADVLPPVTDFVVPESLDETEAGAARRRLRDGPLPRLEPDASIVAALLPGEWVVAVRPQAVLERRQASACSTAGLTGTLYLTSCRLLHVGRHRIAYDVADIREAIVAGDARLLLMVGDGIGLQLDIERPRLLRVKIAAVRRHLGVPAF